MNFYDINGNIIPISGGGKSINYSDYEKNLERVIDEDFTTSNSNFTLSNCSVSSSGLTCTGFASAKYKYIENLYGEKIAIRFTYTGTVTLGVYLSSTLAYIDTAGTLSIYTGYTQGSTLPSSPASTDSVSITSGHEYLLTLFHKGHDYSRATLRDLISGEETTLTSSYSNTRDAKALGISVFNGTATVSKLMYDAPLFSGAKLLVVGDSITWGGAVTPYSDSFASKLVTEYFSNDGTICAYGGDSITGGIKKVTELFERGHKFDYVLMALGTNVDWDRSSNWDYATQISARRTTFANFDALCESRGATLLWGAPPANPNDDLTESLEEAEADTTTKGYPSRTILRKLIIDVFGERCIRFDLATMTNGAYDSQYFADGLHTNAKGQLRQYEFAKAKFDILG